MAKRKLGQELRLAKEAAATQEKGTQKIASRAEAEARIKQLSEQYKKTGSTPAKEKAAHEEAQNAEVRYADPSDPIFKDQAIQEQKPSGMQNVKDVLSIALNPFSKEKIAATTDNRVFNTAAEYIANAPYLTAAILTGAAGAAKTIIGKATAETGIKLIEGKAGAAWVSYAANTKTATQTAGILAKIGAELKKPLFVLSAVGASIGTYPWAEWALGEAKEGMIFNLNKALSTNDPELIKEYRAQMAEIFDVNLWENIARKIPLANIAYAFGEKAQALQAQMKVNDKILADRLIQLETGETEEQTTKRNTREQQIMIDDAKTLAEHQRKTAALYASDAKRSDMIEAGNYWAAQAEKQRKLEEADRKAIAEFWNNYRETKQKAIDTSRPYNWDYGNSNLNFGLL